MDDNGSLELFPKMTWKAALARILIMFLVISSVYLGGIFLFVATSKAIDKASKNAAQHYIEIQKSQKVIETLRGK